jgi:DNA repair photolyase
MYALTPLKVYALDRVLERPECVVRMERMLGAMGLGLGDVATITEGNLGEVTQELLALWPPPEVPSGRVRSFMRPLVFTTIDLSYRRPDLRPLLSRCAPGTSLDLLGNVYGHMGTAIDQHPHERDRHDDCVCWPTYNFGTVVGCSHGCLYCGSGRGGKFLSIALNLEEYMAKIVGPVIENNPWNRVFRMILHGADLITLEPEYGLFDLFTRKLAQYEGRYGHFHTGSGHVDWLADLPHKDRLVGVWSVPSETVARELEPGAGSPLERIGAGRKCNAMGIPVRYKLKPVVPVRNWREEYALLLKQAVTLSRPESIGFCLYIWNSFESMSETLPLAVLDPECVEAARATASTIRDKRVGPFPHEIRKLVYQHLIREVRRWDKEVKLYLSTETREMWDELKDELGQDPSAYVCACSSVAVPGGGLALNPGLRYSTYHPTPV